MINRYINNDLGHICLDCLNKKYKIKLKEEDCDYDIYPHSCCRCGNVKMIVSDIRFSKRILLIFK